LHRFGRGTLQPRCLALAPAEGNPRLHAYSWVCVMKFSSDYESVGPGSWRVGGASIACGSSLASPSARKPAAGSSVWLMRGTSSATLYKMSQNNPLMMRLCMSDLDFASAQVKLAAHAEDSTRRHQHRADVQRICDKVRRVVERMSPAQTEAHRLSDARRT
jgi:hypothetical protein